MSGLVDIFGRGKLPVIVLFAATTLDSCQTAGILNEPLSLPVVLQPAFQACAPSENEARFNIEKDGARVFSSNIVWLIDGAMQTSLQINSPLGETMFELRRSEGRWESLPDNRIKIQENPSGDLSLDGYDIPLKSDELGCILSGVWPAAWLRWMDIVQNRGSVIRLQGEDRFRTITIETPNPSSTNPTRMAAMEGCAEIRWGGFLGFFRRKATLCRKQSKEGVVMHLTGINKYLIDWTINDG